MNVIAKIFKFLVSPRTILGLVGLAVIGAVVRFGGRYGIVGQTLLLVTLGLVIITLLLMLLVGKRKKKESEQIEQSLITEADSLVDTAEAEQKQARTEARQELVAAINALKQSQLARGRTGSSALYILPWYLVLGREEAGKSTLIRSSGLELPGRGPGEIKGIGSSRNCEWWFTNQAVLLEAHHRFADIERAQTSERDWSAFLEELAKHRRRRALNGVVVTISAEDLIHHDVERLSEQARLLRKRLDELIHRLKLVCPIYLVITKADLLHGFGEFFHDLEGPARNQIWGATFSAAQMAQAPAEKVFGQEFHLLYRTLVKRRLPRLIREERPEPKAGIYLFPLEFYALGDRLERVVRVLAEPDAYGYTPLLRGFYLTSGGGEGTPVEVVMTEVSRVIGFPTPGGSVAAAYGAPRFGAPPNRETPPIKQADQRRSTWPLFLKGFFFQVLIPDFALAQPTAGAARRHHLVHLGLRVAVFAGLALLAWLVVAGYVSHRSLIGRTQRLAVEASKVGLPAPITRQTATAATIGPALSKLEGLRRELAETGRGTPLLCSGIRRLDARASEVYLDRLAELLLAPSYYRLGSRLGQQNPMLGEGNTWLKDYELYRQLRDPTGIKSGLPGDWAQRLEALWARDGGANLPQQPISGHLELAWRHRDQWSERMARLTPAPDPQLEWKARSGQQKMQDPFNLYPRLVAELNAATPSFTLETAGVSATFAVETTAALPGDLRGGVPGAFTRVGWQRFRDKVLNPAGDAALSGLPNLSRDQLIRLVDMYADESVEVWASFLASAALRGGADVADAAQLLRRMAAEDSPLLLLLAKAGEQLDLGREIDGGNELLAPAKRIETAFAALRALNGRPTDKEYLGKLGAMAGWLRDLAEAGEGRPRRAAEFTRGVMSGGGEGGPFEDYRKYVNRHCSTLEGQGEKTSNDALAALLMRPAGVALQACLRETGDHLDRSWRESVYDRFASSLAGRFPFSADGADAALTEFGEFFGPAGSLESFRREALAPYLEEGSDRPKEVEGAALRLHPGALGTLKKAAEIRKALFADGSASPKVRFEVVVRATTGASEVVRGSVLDLDGVKLRHEQGAARSQTFAWPGSSDVFRAEVGLLAPEGVSLPPPLKVEGRWAIFRLLRQQSVRVTTAADPLRCQVIVSFSSNRGQIQVPYGLTVHEASANPFVPGFFDFNCQGRLVE